MDLFWHFTLVFCGTRLFSCESSLPLSRPPTHILGDWAPNIILCQSKHKHIRGKHGRRIKLDKYSKLVMQIAWQKGAQYTTKTHPTWLISAPRVTLNTKANKKFGGCKSVWAKGPKLVSLLVRNIWSVSFPRHAFIYCLKAQVKTLIICMHAVWVLWRGSFNSSLLHFPGFFLENPSMHFVVSGSGNNKLCPVGRAQEISSGKLDHFGQGEFIIRCPEFLTAHLWHMC